MSEHALDAKTIHDSLPPANFYDPVIETYKKDIDITLVRENLKLTVEERFRKHASFMKLFHGLREAGKKNRKERS